MDLEELKDLILFLEKRDFAEIEYENEGVRIKLCKMPTPPQSIHYIPSQISQEQSISQPGQWERSDTGEAPDQNGLITIESPIVGTFYKAPSPEEDPFIEVGDLIEKGQVLCIIEAMKVMNEIESEMEGRVKSILVENSQPVGYGDPLFVIEPI